MISEDQVLALSPREDPHELVAPYETVIGNDIGANPVHNGRCVTDPLFRKVPQAQGTLVTSGVGKGWRLEKAGAQGN